MPSAKEVVVGFQGAMGDGDWATARRHLADDLAFQGPFESFDRAFTDVDRSGKRFLRVPAALPEFPKIDCDGVC